MARITRKELKTDKFALEVGHTVSFFEEHRAEAMRYGAIALGVVVLAIVVQVYRNRQHMAREEALSKAILIQEAPVGLAATGAVLVFPTQEAKEKEALRAFTDLSAKYSGSDEGIIAEYYLGCLAADQGKFAEAEKHYKKTADQGDAKYASLARLSLAQIYFADGRAAQGEQLLRSLIDKPTIFVSKELASVALARGIMTTKPAEARKLLEPLRTVRNSNVSQIAIQLYSELPAQ